MKAKGGLHFVCVTGISASGKDYQSELLIKDIPTAVVLSPGDLMRKARSPDDKNHGLLNPYLDYLKVGGIFPSEATMGILSAEIEDNLEKGTTTFVLTGFPRSDDNIKFFDDYLVGIRNRFENVRDDLVYLDIDESDAFLRRDIRVEGCIRRGIEVREDDLPGVMEKKIVVFNNETLPVINRLISEGRMAVINARGTKDETQIKLRRQLKWELLHHVENGLPPQTRK